MTQYWRDPIKYHRRCSTFKTLINSTLKEPSRDEAEESYEPQWVKLLILNWWTHPCILQSSKGGLLRLLTLRSTTLGPKEGLERLRRGRWVKGRKGRRLGSKGESNQASEKVKKGGEGGFHRKVTNWRCKSAGKAQGHWPLPELQKA